MLRNREFRLAAEWFVLTAAVLAVAGFAYTPAAGWMALLCAAALGVNFFIFTRARYARIAQLSEQIDLVLHNAGRLSIMEAEEGELSILQSEINKMILRIRQQNDMLKRDKEQLAESLADIAHQLRTPLTSVNIILSLFADETGRSGRETLAREAEELLLRMEHLVTALLNLSRLDAGIVTFQSEWLDINGLFCTALRPLMIPMELHHIPVQTEIPQDARLFGDAGWLAEAIQNILKNCMESTGDYGEIIIQCTDTPLFVEIVIRDNGPGFSGADLPHLFERFYRGKCSRAAGYGIGLALCRTIITRQGGTVTAKNHPQGGAAFVIRFPKQVW